MPPKFNELRKQKKLFTVTWGKKKFKVAFPYYQVLQVSFVPATSHSTLEIEEPKAQTGTPLDDNKKKKKKQVHNTNTEKIITNFPSLIKLIAFISCQLTSLL